VHSKAAGDVMPKKDANRCWPGYEPVPGKTKNEQGSCKKKADSKLAASEASFRKKREKQLQDWKKEHPGSPKKAAQHLHKPGTTPKTAAKPKPKQQSDSRTKTRTAK
jgi:hypothetical protein